MRRAFFDNRQSLCSLNGNNSHDLCRNDRKKNNRFLSSVWKAATKEFIAKFCNVLPELLCTYALEIVSSTCKSK